LHSHTYIDTQTIKALLGSILSHCH